MLEESAILQFLLGGWVSENSRCLTVFVVVFCDFILLASAFSQSNMFSYHFTARDAQSLSHSKQWQSESVHI
jgi:hypothetical protein